MADDDLWPIRSFGDKDFARFFQDQRSACLVFLNACSSAVDNRTEWFTGLARAYLAHGRSPSVVAMQYPLGEKGVAKTFAKAFYEGLASGQAADIAVSQARSILFSEVKLSHRHWSVPVLYLRTPSAQTTNSDRDAAEQEGRSNTLQGSGSTPSIAEPERDSVQDPSTPSAKICEEFQGFVEKLEGEIAYVRLDSTRGERLWGPYPADELTTLGIEERTRFILKTLEIGNSIRFEVSPIPRVKLTSERECEIDEETERLFGEFDPSDDY
jgi:hypothetical protein